MSIDRPIIILGTHRSGTSWLGNAFDAHGDIAYWEEPRHVWMRGNAYKPDYRLKADDASAWIKRFIRDRFERYRRERGASHLAEKTPSNCLRVPFIREVFPSARIVFLVRDGRSVLRSNRQIARKGVGLSRIYRRALSTPLSEWAAYAPRAVGAIRRRTVGGPPPYWGPRPPGWKRILREHPEPVALAKIWASTITYAADDLQRCWSGEVFWVRYEDLVVDPRSQAGAMLDHLGIENPEPILRFLESSADPSRATKWRRELTDETLGLVEPAMRPTLERFGYTW